MASRDDVMDELEQLLTSWLRLIGEVSHAAPPSYQPQVALLQSQISALRADLEQRRNSSSGAQLSQQQLNSIQQSLTALQANVNALIDQASVALQ
jgi:uncharacterized protein involved in exopolysaccharide biosynthesis